MQYVYEAWKKKRIKLSDEVFSELLLNPSLYNRGEKDFKYTVNVFHMMTNPSQAGSYIKDTSVINLKEFMENGTDNFMTDVVKPGLTGNGGDTIFNVVERWAKDNEFSIEEIAQNNAGKSTDWNYEWFENIVNKVFAKPGKITCKLKSIDDYLERLYYTFSLHQVKCNPPQDNVINATDLTQITDKDVSKFGKVEDVDTPIHLTVVSTDTDIPGIYVFHKFVPMDTKNMSTHQSNASKNLTDLKSAMSQLDADGKTGDEKVQGIMTAIEGLSAIPVQ
jgi:hypothetical protein